jgi:hypothetical protein
MGGTCSVQFEFDQKKAYCRMASKIHWRIMFRVNDRKAFDKCRTRVTPLLGPECEWSEGRPYWKIPELWECTVIVPYSVGSIANQVLASLLMAQRLASGWFILGSLSEETAIGFSGVFSIGANGGSSNVAGLEWASFDLL